jgi:hypothetical protein
MKRVIFVLSFLLFSWSVFSQTPPPPSPQQQQQPQFQSQEVSEADGIPVLIKHLPEWEKVQSDARLIKSQNDLRAVLGARPVFDLIDFEGGTEAVTAPYEVGKLLIVEYNTPQASIDTDNKVKQYLAENPQQNPPIFYRRIGNYNVFLFDGADEQAASELIGQVKYEKIVQWLGEDPFLYERVQRSYVTTLTEIFFATILAIVSGIGLSILAGIGVGVLFFYVRKKQRDESE